MSKSARTDFLLDSPEQALHDRRPAQQAATIPTAACSTVSIRYTIEHSVGSVGESYDNALAETINGL